MIATQQKSEQNHLSPKGLEELLRLLVAGQSRRVSSAVVDGRTVWIKRMDAEGVPFFKRLHAWVSPLIPWAALRSSRIITSPEMVAREIEKTAAFRAAGFPAAHVLFTQGSVLVLSNADTIVQAELDSLRVTDLQAHDALLVQTATALAAAHQAGLCHGRPHPRDMILEGERIGFLDFEEAPEKAMPLADAQARDVFLLFLQICGQALDEDTGPRAFEAYRADAPADVMPHLASLRGVFSLMHSALGLVAPIGLGGDGRRLYKASAFLNSMLSPEAGAAMKTTLPETLSGQKPKATR